MHVNTILRLKTHKIHFTAAAGDPRAVTQDTRCAFARSPCKRVVRTFSLALIPCSWREIAISISIRTCRRANAYARKPPHIRMALMTANGRTFSEVIRFAVVFGNSTHYHHLVKCEMLLYHLVNQQLCASTTAELNWDVEKQRCTSSCVRARI